MSWDRRTILSHAPCACGCGTVVKIEHIAEDDWNRTIVEEISFDIKCDECKKKYRVETIQNHFLVPRDIDVPQIIIAKPLHYFYSSCEEQIACSFSYNTLKLILSDMKCSKFATRLKYNESKQFMDIFKRRTKKRNLPDALACLETVIAKYNVFRWNFDKIIEYRQQENDKITQNKLAIESVVSQSFRLNF